MPRTKQTNALPDVRVWDTRVPLRPIDVTRRLEEELYKTDIARFSGNVDAWMASTERLARQRQYSQANAWLDLKRATVRAAHTNGLMQATLYVDKDVSKRIQAAMTNSEHALDREETIEVEAEFPDGRRILVRCFGAPGYDDVRDTSLAEATLLTSEGAEIATTEAEEQFFGLWTVDDPVLRVRYEVETRPDQTEMTCITQE